MVPNSADHGWQRSNELHVLADAASSVLMLAVGVASLLLAIRPFRHSILVSWMAGTLAVISLGTAASTLMQGHDGLAGAAVTGLVFLCVFVAPLVLLHPERRLILSGGAPSAGAGPTGPLVAAFALMGVLALGSAVAVTWWRITGGLFENPAEDDAISLTMLALALATGFGLCALGREGWRGLAKLLTGMLAYCVVVGITLAVA